MDVGKPREMVRDREACRAGDGAAESHSTWQLNNNNSVYGALAQNLRDVNTVLMPLPHVVPVKPAPETLPSTVNSALSSSGY